MFLNASNRRHITWSAWAGTLQKYATAALVRAQHARQAKRQWRYANTTRMMRRALKAPSKFKQSAYGAILSIYTFK